MREQYELLGKQQEIRGILMEIREAIGNEKERQELQRLFEQAPEFLFACLSGEDPKARKNAAKILGNLRGEDIPQRLWQAYEREGQLFVREDYLKALENFDCALFLDQMRVRQEELEGRLNQICTEEDVFRGLKKQDGSDEERNKEGEEKHLRRELQALRKILLKGEKPKFHGFAGLLKPADVILLTNRGQEALTAGQIQKGRVRLGKGLVQVEQASLEELLKIRTWRELLFQIPGIRRLNLEEGAKTLLSGEFEELLGSLLFGEPPYYFRIELKNRLALSKRSQLARHFAARLEEQSGGFLKNAPSAYEIELRLTEGREERYVPFLKLKAFPDQRFAYRKRTVAASLSPVQAAICMELAAPYLREKARVLDPFCGTGAMLLERNYKRHADTLYGIDLYAPAIEGARENAELAGVPAHFVNRDCLTFRHERPFDEIVTNFPVKGKTRDAHTIDCLYGQFLDHAGSLLGQSGVILLYSHDRGYVKKHLRQRPQWQLLQEWCVSEKEEAFLFCIRRV